MKDNKFFSTYDCFYLVKNNNKESKILLSKIIYGVNYVINKLSNNRLARSAKSARSERSEISSRSSLSSKSDISTSISDFIKFYDIYSKNYNENSKTIYKYKKNNILKTYMKFDENKYNRSAKIKEYLDMLKQTQNGYGDIPKIIDKYFNDNNITIPGEFNDNLKIVKGGESLSYTNQICLPALLDFCQYNDHFLGTVNNDIKQTLISLYHLVSQSYNFVALYYFITNNDQDLNYKYTINFYNYNIDNYDIIVYDQGSPNYSTEFIRECSFKEYNREIILSYEIFQFDYRINLQNYIDQQMQYISTLTNAEKNIIKDYTRPRTFNFLNEYIINPTPGFISRYKQKWNLRAVNAKLSNSFCDIISTVLPHINIDAIKNKQYFDNADSSYNFITEDEWHIILQIYLVELNRIILGAPATTDNFLCFRGSSSDYIMQNNTYTTQNEVINIYLSNSRPSSISFNFDAANMFYKLGSANNSIMYRILVTPGCKLLFASPLSHNATKGEMEFIVPLHHVFATIDLFTKVEAYNNFNNKNNICLNAVDKLNSKDIILLPI
jgi:hypothetical protein